MNNNENLDHLITMIEGGKIRFGWEEERFAAFYAAIRHGSQLRKYTFEPYIVHPAEVAAIVKTVPCTREMVMAAWLHDVVEDCGVHIDEITNLFGWGVSTIVDDLTDKSKGMPLNRKARKQIDLEHSAKSSPHAQTVKLADLISNSRDIVKHDPKFAKVYLAEKDKLLGVLTKGNPELWKQAAAFVRKP